MWFLGIACALVATTYATPQPPAPAVARVAYGDLDPTSRDDQAELVARVRRASNAFCAEHGSAVTPYLRRGEADYCHRVIRVRLIDELPVPYREAYDRGWARGDRRMP